MSERTFTGELLDITSYCCASHYLVACFIRESGGVSYMIISWSMGKGRPTKTKKETTWFGRTERMGINDRKLGRLNVQFVNC